ncbi:MAG: hypothetical protein HZA54_09815 [Planctomycetes bacterium]|nr:hypothetical protein [Planctomycetota bacterium]
MRTLIAASLLVGLVLGAAGPAFACGGHESRAADCLERLFGDSHVAGMSDHRLTVSVDGETMTATGAEQGMVDQLANFLLEHGVEQTSADPCDRTSDAHNLFDDSNLAG